MNNLKDIRKIHGYTQTEIAKKLNISQQTYANYENNKTEAPHDILKQISTIYDISIDILLGNTNENLLTEKPNRIPVLGRIPAGIPIEMIEEVLDYEDIPLDWLKGNKKYFALKVNGESMSPKFLDGDVLIVNQQDNCENGAYAIVTVNGNDATFKKVIKKEEGIILQPLNPNFEPVMYSNKDIQELPIRILGVVVEIRRSI